MANLDEHAVLSRLRTVTALPDSPRNASKHECQDQNADVTMKWPQQIRHEVLFSPEFFAITEPN